MQGDRIERYEVIVIGGGQAGLATGYQLRRAGIPFVILDAGARVGDAWRHRWDSLRLFTPARYDGLPGMPFPADRHVVPGKDEVADYLEAYAARFELPVRLRTRVGALRALDEGGGFVATSAHGTVFEARQVVLATGAYHEPFVPRFAPELDPAILQLHSSAYRNPSQLRDGQVLVVGAGNSGAEIALDIAQAGRATTLSGRDTGTFAVSPESWTARLVDPFIWFGANHLLTPRNPIGRRAWAAFRQQGTPVERARPARLRAAGVERVAVRIAGVRDGLPMLADGRVVEAASVVWATGFRRDYGWIRPPIAGPDGWPQQDRGAVTGVPGLYVMGIPFQTSLASGLIGGVGRDAESVVGRIRRALPGRAASIAGQPAPGEA